MDGPWFKNKHRIPDSDLLHLCNFTRAANRASTFPPSASNELCWEEEILSSCNMEAEKVDKEANTWIRPLLVWRKLKMQERTLLFPIACSASRYLDPLLFFSFSCFLNFYFCSISRYLPDTGPDQQQNFSLRSWVTFSCRWRANISRFWSFGQPLQMDSTTWSISGQFWIGQHGLGLLFWVPFIHPVSWECRTASTSILVSKTQILGSTNI